MNVHDAAIQVLKDAGKPLHAKEIAAQIIDAGLWKSDGKTPEATISARIYSDIKKNGDKSAFVKVAPQTFTLREVQFVAACDAQDKDSVMVRTEEPVIYGAPPKGEAMSFLQSAETVFEFYGNKQPMH